MIEVLYLVAFVLAIFGLGNLIIGLFKLKFFNYWDQVVFSQVIGLAAMIYLTLGIGLAGFLHSFLFTIIFLALILVNTKSILNLVSASVSAIRKIPLKFNLNTFLVLTLLGFIIFNLVASLAPLSASDSVSYHLAIPKIYAENNGIINIPYIIPSNYPLATEMIFLSGYLIKNEILAEMIAFYIAILLTSLIYLFSKKYFSNQIALIASVIFYTLPIIIVFNIRAYVDISTALFGFAALYAFFIWQDNGKLLFLSGILAGVSFGTKLSAAPLIVALAGVIVCRNLFFKKNMVLVIKDSAIYGMGVVLSILPWTAKTFLHTGNPIYPFAFNIFGGESLTPRLLTFWFEESLRFVGFGTSIVDLFLLPWNLTMNSTAFHEQLLLGPFILAVFPLIFFIGKIDRRIISLILIVLSVLVMWFFTAQQPRYTIVSFALLSVITAYIISRLLASRLHLLASFLIIATIMINAFLLVGANNDEVRAALGFTQKDAYLSSKISNYGLVKYANENLPFGTKLCLYGQIGGFYNDHDYVWCHPAFQGHVDFYNMEFPAQLSDRLKEIGVTHVLVEHSIEDSRRVYYEKGLTIGTQAFDNAHVLFDKVLKDNGKLIFENKEGYIYELFFDNEQNI